MVCVRMVGWQLTARLNTQFQTTLLLPNEPEHGSRQFQALPIPIEPDKRAAVVMDGVGAFGAFHNLFPWLVGWLVLDVGKQFPHVATLAPCTSPSKPSQAFPACQ